MSVATFNSHEQNLCNSETPIESGKIKAKNVQKEYIE